VSSFVGFIGKHDLRIDGKGRVTMPSRFKKTLREQYPDDCDTVVVRLTLDLNLTVEPVPEYARVAEKFENYDGLDEETRRLQEIITGLATVEKIDAGGRIRLSLDLRTIAGLLHEVTLVGRNRSFDIWDRARWQATQDVTLRDLKHLTEQVRRKHRAD
jgi:MraZ protein